MEEKGRIALMEIEKLATEALSWPAKANAITITNQATYDLAANTLLAIKDLRKQINESYDPIISKAFSAHREACSQKKKVEEPLIMAEGIIKTNLGAFVREQERIRQEAERQAREAAAKLEEELRIQQAVMAEEAGFDEAAIEEVLQTPIPLPAPVIAPTFDKVSGISSRKIWKWRIVNETLIPREYLQVNEMAINSVVRGMKGSTRIPGIEVYEETSIAAGRR
jgi:hypothetical protein